MKGVKQKFWGDWDLFTPIIRIIRTAMSYYQEALKIREKVDDKLLMGNSLNSIGVNLSII